MGDPLKNICDLKQEVEGRRKTISGRSRLDRAIAKSIDILSLYKHKDEKLGALLFKEACRQFEAVYGEPPEMTKERL